MEPLVNGRPGPHECWDELADHSLTHDDVNPATWTAAVGIPEMTP